MTSTLNAISCPLNRLTFSLRSSSTNGQIPQPRSGSKVKCPTPGEREGVKCPWYAGGMLRLQIDRCIIGSFMTRDVFVAAPSVLTCESRESVTFVDESESSQREVVTDSPGWVDFPSWKLTLHGHLSDYWRTAVHANCRICRLVAEVNLFGLGEPRD